jgi:hypothetical protein
LGTADETKIKKLLCYPAEREYHAEEQSKKKGGNGLFHLIDKVLIQLFTGAILKYFCAS